MKIRQLRLKHAVLITLRSQTLKTWRGTPRVYYRRGKRGVCQAHSFFILVVLQRGYHPKPLGIALEQTKIIALDIAQLLKVLGAVFLKPVSNSLFTGMAERRVANIVRQTAGLNNIAYVRWFQPGGQIAGGLQRITHTHSQGTPYAGDFQAVSEAVVHMIVGGQRVNLCLASQATKRARENDFVVIRIKRRSALFTFGGPIAQTLGAQKLFPIHGHGHASPVMTQ